MPTDNARVVKPKYFAPIKRKYVRKQIPIIYDTKKAKYYENMQNFYNSNFFGRGVFGTPTKYNPITEQDKIQAEYDYAKGNVNNFTTSLVSVGIPASFKGVIPPKGTKLGKLSDYTPYKIGEGAESIVINNSPTTVGKITQTSSKEMLQRNKIPASAKQKFKGYVRDGLKRFPVFTQQKLKITTDKTLPKYLNKLDEAMYKGGFRKVNDPSVQYRAYTNGNVIIDDIYPNNVGVTIFGKPKLIDFVMEPIGEF